MFTITNLGTNEKKDIVLRITAEKDLLIHVNDNPPIVIGPGVSTQILLENNAFEKQD